MSQKPFAQAQYAEQPNRNSKSSGKAITSFILGLSSFFCAFFTGSVAIIFGVLALGDISKSRGRLQGQGFAIAGIVLGGIGCLWTLIWIALLLPAVQQVREAARQATSVNNVMQISFGLQNFADTHMRFPPVHQDAEGLSWRVHILPYIEEQELYDQFHLDEPWDSPHNLTLVDRMPDIFRNPNHQLEPGKTMYLVPTTPESTDPSLPRAVFVQGQLGPRFSDIRDGTSNTILILEADPEAVVTWTDPDGDWLYDPGDSMRSLGKARPRVIVVGFADGRVQAINNQISPQDMNALITRDAGDIANIY